MPDQNADITNLDINASISGMDRDSNPSQIKKGQVTYALNAVVDGEKQISYQNEPGNHPCVELPKTCIKTKTIVELDMIIYFLAPDEIGFSKIGECTYHTLVKAPCLNFNLSKPIRKVEYEINGEAVRLYWADDNNPDRYLDINNIAYKKIRGNSECDVQVTTDLDCNAIKVQANFSIPYIELDNVGEGGTLVEGTYQFGIQYSDAIGTAYTGVYNISNPVPIFRDAKTTQDFNNPTGKSISLNIHNLDVDKFEHFNLIVVKTINGVSTPELVGTYPTSVQVKTITYTGQKTDIRLSMDDVFQEFPIYERSKGVTQSDKVLIWYGVTESKRVNYQEIASQVKLKWVKYKLPPNFDFSDPEIAEKYKGYMSDEVYAFEIQPILRNGKKCDSFHIPNRPKSDYDREIVQNPLYTPELCNTDDSTVERWVVRNTATTTHSYDVDITDDPDYAQIQRLQNKIDHTNDEIDDLNNQIIDLNRKLQTQLATYNDIVTGAYDAGPLPSGEKLINTSVAIWFKDNMDDDQKAQTLKAINLPDPQLDDFPDNFPESWYLDEGTWPLMSDILNDKEDYRVLISNLSDKYTSLNKLYVEINKLAADSTICNPTLVEEGEFGYYESDEKYPCNKEIWGDLAGKNIRYHRFPRGIIHDDYGNIYTLGVEVDVDHLKEIIKNSSLTQEQKDNIAGFKILRASRVNNKSVVARGLINNVGIYTRDGDTHFYPNYPYNDVRADPFISIAQTRDDTGTNAGLALNGFIFPETKSRFTFHSPDTSFYQPNLGDYIQIESIEYGQSQGHFVPVDEHPKYQIPSRAAYATIIVLVVGLISAGAKKGIPIVGIGEKTDWNQALAVFQQALEIITKAIPHKELAYQFNSVGNYTRSKPIPEEIEYLYPIKPNSRYISDGLADVNDIYKLNNFLRESAVYLSTYEPIPFTHEFYPEIEDRSRWTLSENDCSQSTKNTPISSYYVSLKRQLKSQYGQIYSYETVDTGAYIDLDSNITALEVFGGDSFVNKFAYKSKQSFFTKNLVGRQDNLALDFRNYGNLGYPTYWLSNERDGKFTWDDALQGAAGILAGSVGGGLGTWSISGVVNGAIAGAILGGISVVADNWQNNFDCAGNKFFYQDGKFYLFAYGIPYFYVESEVNVNFRQAFNSNEGNFYPNMGEGIPDEWLQEINTPIVNDNTYFYNKTYSKQNKEAYFHHLPNDFDNNRKDTLVNRAVYSEKQSSETNYKVNKWLLYRPLSKYDFPQTNGKLISLDRIKDRAILARFENKSELYNAMLKIDTSNPQAAYIGNTTLFSSAPPIDYSDTDTGYMGTQHTLFLKTPYGNISTDAKRGKIFNIQGQKAVDITKGMSSFLRKKLDFEIIKHFPEIDIDNAFSGIGLTGTYDDYHKRVLITKLDYKPVQDGIIYKDGVFVYNNQQVSLNDPNYFENQSFTLSYYFPGRSWTSFHSYLPNFYIEVPNSFYTCTANKTWYHLPDLTLFNNFYSEIHEYILEFPSSYKYNDEIIQSIQDYSVIKHYNSDNHDDYNIVNDVYFNKAIVYNKEQCSGILNLVPKPKHNMKAYMGYPKFNEDSKDILFTRSNSFYQFNTFWNVTKTTPIFRIGSDLSHPSVLNNENMDYSKRSFKKELIRAKDGKIRLILDNTDKYELKSQFIVTKTMQSIK